MGLIYVRLTTRVGPTTRPMVLCSFQCWGILLLLHIVGQGPAVLAAGAGQVGYIFFFIFFIYLPFLMSCHCDCQRKIGPFVGMISNFQPNCGYRPSCGNDV